MIIKHRKIIEVLAHELKIARQINTMSNWRAVEDSIWILRRLAREDNNTKGIQTLREHLRILEQIAFNNWERAALQQ